MATATCLIATTFLMSAEVKFGFFGALRLHIGLALRESQKMETKALLRFTSRRLSYRRPASGDAVNLFSLDNDPDVMRWINGGEEIQFKAFSEAQLPIYLAQTENSLLGFWLIHRGSQFVGWVSLRATDTSGEATLGYRLSQAHWGLGYATEAASALIREAFIHVGLKDLVRIKANTYELNTGSQRVLDKLGFSLHRREKPSIDALVSTDTSIGGGEVWDGDEYYYGLDRSAFTFV